MTLLQQWRNTAYSETANKGDLQRLWTTYFEQEKDIYAQLLANPSEEVKGTVKELAEKYDITVMTMVGFLDGINDSLKEANPIETMEEDTVVQQPQIVSNTNLTYGKVFVVHGHDGELKQAVARIIEKQGIEAIILSEQANKGRTIIEKFEDYSDVSGAICLFTADDYGRAKKDEADNTRARQNVVLETGYFMGKLGRDHVVLLADKGIEMPSDLSGVVYTDTGSWQFALLKEMDAMGYKVDLNKLL